MLGLDIYPAKEPCGGLSCLMNVRDVLVMSTGTAFRISGNILQVSAVHDLSTRPASASTIRGYGYARLLMDGDDKYSCPESWHTPIVCPAEKASNDTESLISQSEVSLPARSSCRGLEYLFGTRRPPNFRRASAASATYAEPLILIQ